MAVELIEKKIDRGSKTTMKAFATLENTTLGGDETTGVVFFDNTMCKHIDYSFERLVEFRSRAQAEVVDPSGVTVSAIALLVSLVFLFFGARLFRITAAVAAAVFAFWVVYSFGRASGERITCEALVIVSFAIGIAAAFAAGCIMKAGLFFIGAAAVGATVHLVYSAFPTLHEIGDQPTIADRSVAYWGLIVVGSVVGGLALRWHSEPVLELFTSLVGGAGVGYSLRSINEIANLQQENWVFLIVGVGCAVCGMIAQRHLRLRRSNRQPDSEAANRARP